MKFVFNDGGRAAAGYKGFAGIAYYLISDRGYRPSIVSAILTRDKLRKEI